MMSPNAKFQPNYFQTEGGDISDRQTLATQKYTVLKKLLRVEQKFTLFIKTFPCLCLGIKKFVN